VSGLNFYPQNFEVIPSGNIFIFLNLKQKMKHFSNLLSLLVPMTILPFSLYAQGTGLFADGSVFKKKRISLSSSDKRVSYPISFE
jgi:hypothetical protein